jgi:gluconolactonase
MRPLPLSSIGSSTGRCSSLERVYDRCRWAEGPVYVPAWRTLIWSDVPNDRMLRLDEASRLVSLFRSPAGFPNGNTLDRQGRLVICEHANRRVTRVEVNGSITVVADRYDGMRLNSPNDVVVKSDGSIWFTDPTYGIDQDYEGGRAQSEIGACHVYRIDPTNGGISAAATDFVRPNGLAFSPDEQWLYVSDTGATHVEDGPRHIRRFRVDSNGRLTDGAELATCSVRGGSGILNRALSGNSA